MSKVYYVKSLFGRIIGTDFSLNEGEIGETTNKNKYRGMEQKGLLIIRDTYEEAKAFKFKSSVQLFHESYPSLNPAPGVIPGPCTIDFANSCPLIINGIPSNYIIEQVEVTKQVEATKPAENKVEDSTVKTMEPELTFDASYISKSEVKVEEKTEKKIKH